MIHKPFDKILFNENDKLARQITKDFYKRQYDLALEDNSNKYGADLRWNKMLFECEIKRVWDGDVFPYNTIQIPERKLKIFSDPEFFEFVMINNELTTLLTIRRVTLLESPLKIVSNKYIKSGESFIQVPVEYAWFFHI